MLEPPIATRIPTERTHHGEVVIDDYAWLLDKENAETVAYLNAENAYTEQATSHLEGLRETIFTEIKSRTKETDLTVPVRNGGFWYYSRTVEGAQYPIYCRRAVVDGETEPPIAVDGAPLDGEHVLLDANRLASGHDFFALGTYDISPDGNRLAYSTDFAGDERFTLRVKDLTTGDDLTDTIDEIFYGSAWSADGSTLFYTRVDGAWRPNQIFRHVIGTETSADVLVFEETDERFWVGVGLTRSERYLEIDSHSKITSEVRLIPADDPTAEPILVRPRQTGLEYHLDHQGDRLLIVHNEDAEDFALAWATIEAPGEWHELVGHVPGVRIDSVDAFAEHLVISLRKDGLTGLRIVPNDGEPFEITFPEPLYSVGLGANPDFHTEQLRVGYASLATPDSVYDYDLASGELILRRRKPVLGGYDPADYLQAREWAMAADGVRVPISIVKRADTPAGGPVVLYGYGSYESSMDPWFSIPRLSLLDRGITYAVAHVRGGGELGRRWYEDGKMLAKRNTFTDFVACAEHLLSTGWGDRIVARGGSAGGLLMGAVANIAPEAFTGILAEVPFVDALNTILDPSLPLTVTEWDEWGNPLESAEVYRYMRSYTPYENVEAKQYPAILAVTSLNDTRVFFHEPAKWIARLRATAPGGSYLLKTEMEAGHGGRSGRYDAWREEAFNLAWVLDRLDLAK
ncbi:S9 family peptidase [Allocatelliglobosispora scoriae]|nr:S9 family peptidase [Allocatelliglobosispora scoriae]